MDCNGYDKYLLGAQNLDMVLVVALEGGHSRVADRTRLTSKGGYPGRCKLFFRSTHGARTHQELEWFGPPERNTLRPLRVVLLLGLRMSLSSALRSPFRPESSSNGRLPFIEQGGRVHRRWTSTGGPNKDVYYTKLTLMVLQ